MNSDISKEEQTNIEYACVKWEGVSNGPKSGWSKKGCTIESSTEGEILCSCNHLTSFAVLVVSSSDLITGICFRLMIYSLMIFSNKLDNSSLIHVKYLPH